MTAHVTPGRSQPDAGDPLPDWHSTFSANADLKCDTVYARGVLDLLTAEVLRGTIDILLSAGRLDVTIDLRGLRHIDRAGLLLITEIQQDLNYRGGSLTLVNASPTVRDLLSTSGPPAAAVSEDA